MAVIALLLPRTYTSSDGLVTAAVLAPIVLVVFAAMRLREHKRLRQIVLLDRPDIVRPRVSHEDARPVSKAGGPLASRRGSIG